MTPTNLSSEIPHHFAYSGVNLARLLRSVLGGTVAYVARSMRHTLRALTPAR